MIQLLLGSSGGAKQSKPGLRCIRGKMSEGRIPTLRGGVSVALRVPWCASKVLRSVSTDVGCASIDVGCTSTDVGCASTDVGCALIDVGCASIDVGERDSIRCASETRQDTITDHTGDKDPYIQWTHCEHIVSTDNM